MYSARSQALYGLSISSSANIPVSDATLLFPSTFAPTSCICPLTDSLYASKIPHHIYQSNGMFRSILLRENKSILLIQKERETTTLRSCPTFVILFDAMKALLPLQLWQESAQASAQCT